MTAIFVFAALIAANVAYAIYDGRCAETSRQVDDYYRVEFKKNYLAQNDKETASVWH